MKVLIIGLGSIGLKHLQVLKKIKPSCEVYALRSSIKASKVKGVINVFSYEDIPSDLSFIIISNPTGHHRKTIQKCLNFSVPLFIEKPPLKNVFGADQILQKIKKQSVKTYVAFNLRFHPVIQWLKKNIDHNKIIETTIYCGSYLPDWRPNIDYRKTYSANREDGGGVTLDLIHEIDYSIWLFGTPNQTYSKALKLSKLEINTEDYANFIFEYANSVLSIQLNYFRKIPKRTIEIVFENDVWYADLLNSTVINGYNEIIFKAEKDIMKTYEKQMNYFISNLDRNESYMNSFAEACQTLKTVIS